jgi:RecB family exonuclease
MTTAGDDPGQATLDGMPRRLFAATPSRLATWVDCPRRYRFTYLDPRPKGPPWAHSSLGAAAHNALRDWWSAPLVERTRDAAARLVRDRWLADGFRDEAQSRRWRETAASWVTEYVAGLDATDEPVGVERTVATTHGGLALSGRVDRIDLRPSDDGGDELVVVDYKTGRSATTIEDARSSAALAIYVACARRTLRRRSRRVELHHLPTGTVSAYEHSEESLQRHLARADDIGAEASAAHTQWRTQLAEQAPAAAAGEADALEAIDAVFPPRPSPRCAWCDFRSACPEGTAVSDGLEPWAALAE